MNSDRLTVGQLKELLRTPDDFILRLGGIDGMPHVVALSEENDIGAVLLFDECSDVEPKHASGCVCADCSGAELTARND